MTSNMGDRSLITMLTIFSLVLATIIFLSSTRTSTFFGSRKTGHDDDRLESALREASTVDKTVIITVVNKAFVEPHNGTYPSMLELFLEGFWFGEDTRGLVKHLLVVAMDQTAYDRCKFMKLNCYKLETEGVDFAGEKVFMSGDYLKMIWRRIFFLSEVLKRGYNFINTDTDILWLRNPFNRLQKINQTMNDEDLFISIDHRDSTEMNAGFYFIRPNNKTITLFETWNAMKENSTGMLEQTVLDDLYAKGMFAKLGLRVKFLDTLYFNCFCTNTIDFENVVTVHANCCRTISAKVNDLKTVLNDWKKFRETGKNLRNGTVTSLQRSDHLACAKSWH